MISYHVILLLNTPKAHRPLAAAGGPKTRWMEISVWNLAPFSWHLKVEVSSIQGTDISYLGKMKTIDSNMPAGARGHFSSQEGKNFNKKKLYIIAFFCTRTSRTLIFPLALSSTIYVPISLSLLKLQEKHQSFKILMYKSSHVLVKSLVKSNDQLIYHGI